MFRLDKLFDKKKMIVWCIDVIAMNLLYILIIVFGFLTRKPASPAVSEH